MVVDVPLDRSGHVPGRVNIAAALYHRPGPPRQAVLALAGGPGSAAIPAAHTFQHNLAPLLANRDLLVIDDRGTGVSGPISCPGIDDSAVWSTSAVAACARRLGPAAGHYGSRDTSDDIEDVRHELGIPSLVVYGVSYGTKTATEYAELHPRHVAGLVLDSPIVDDTDPFYRRSAVGAARVLQNLCAEGECPAGADPVADITAIVAKMHGTGTLSSGGVTVTEGAMLHAIVEGGSTLRALPKALHAAAAGDLRALAAVLPKQIPDARDPDWLKSTYSQTMYLATSCDDGNFPWPGNYSVRGRYLAAGRYLQHIGDAAFAPFDRAVGVQYGETKICAPWPAAQRQAPLPKIPDVPALLLVGGDDDIAPLEGAREIAGRLPHSQIVVIPARGHGELRGGGDPSGQALQQFAATLPGA